MRSTIDNFKGSILNKDEMRAIGGGIMYYWACDDDYDKIAYMTPQAALNHCLESPACTTCSKFEIPIT